MNITQYFSISQISLDCDIYDRDELFEYMIGTIIDNPVSPFPSSVKDKALWLLEEREKHTASNMGNGIFVPHARVEGIDYPAIAMATLSAKAKAAWIEKYKIDAKIFVMLIIPKEQPTLGLKLIAGIAQLFEKPDLLSEIGSMKSSKAAYSKIQAITISSDISLRLRNIMNRDIDTLSPDTKLSEAVRIMHIKRYQSMPVVDDSGAVVGEVTADMLLSHGIPDFFKNLATVSFIREFDPLEKYFANEASLTCSDCMNAEPCCLSEEATILESIFELSIRKHQCIYIVENNKLVGSVNSNTVLDKLLNI